jgi:hypothetical protein
MNAPDCPMNLRLLKYNGSEVAVTARNKVDLDTVRSLALGLPDVEESTTWGSTAFKARGKLMTCIPVHKSAEPGSLAVRIPFDQRVELMAADPEVYYLTDHYVNYPMVLVRLSRIHADALRDLLDSSWRFVTAKTPGKRAVRKR